MLKNDPLILGNKKPSRLAKSQSDHFVQFYSSDDHLMAPLTKFISTGLDLGEVCIVIATESHLHSLNERLILNGISVTAAQQSGQYVALDAADTLAKFMVDGLPSRDKFFKAIGSLVEVVAQNNKPIRAYGEMVALLWKTGNKEAVIQLENLWNELAGIYKFSLYCAYPELHFIMDNDVRDEIDQCHGLSLHGLATA